MSGRRAVGARPGQRRLEFAHLLGRAVAASHCHTGSSEARRI